MALIIMACYDTEENGRSEYTERTLKSLAQTVNWDRHRLVIVDNGSCSRTKQLLNDCVLDMWLTMPDYTTIKPHIITNPTNLGTARAINQGIRLRNPGEYVVKADNDVEWHSAGWVDEMEAAIERDTGIGILGLKRKDIDFDANHTDPSYRSELVQLPHAPGETWITVERGPSIMGTCTMFNWRLLDAIGFMRTCGIYGFDDSLFSLRSGLAGFWNAYLPHIVIDHIDTGDNPYTQVKQQQAGAVWDEYHKLHAAYVDGTRPVWEDCE